MTMEHANSTPRPVVLDTPCGALMGTQTDRCRRFLGVPYARAERFRYAEPVTHWDGTLDASKPGPACPQNRAIHEHLENPTRRFYKREFRDGLTTVYDEDCLNLNIFTPPEANGCPVVVFIHGGGFDSGMNTETPFDGSGLAARGIITVFVNYRVGVLGYLTHAQIRQETGRDGNFGLDDVRTAIRWVRANIAAFGGDAENLTLLGQSAGAITIQYLCLDRENETLFRRAAMMSGAGLFPKFALPRRAEDTHAYWLELMNLCACRTLDELRRAELSVIFDAVETMRRTRRDNTYNTMPVIDGAMLPAPVDTLIRNPLPIDYLIGYTNTDLYAPIMARIGTQFAKTVHGYVYDFDLDAPGDANHAFHSSDLRYIFETLEGSWRPYGARDREASEQLAQYLANFARTGDPNGEGLPQWQTAERGVLKFGRTCTRMGHTNYCKLTWNFLTRGEPKG